jgi:hypothetical protein
MGTEGVPLYRFSLLWDAEVGAVNRHEAVIANAAMALKVDLRLSERRMTVM